MDTQNGIEEIDSTSKRVDDLRSIDKQILLKAVWDCPNCLQRLRMDALNRDDHGEANIWKERETEIRGGFYHE